MSTIEAKKIITSELQGYTKFDIIIIDENSLILNLYPPFLSPKTLQHIFVHELNVPLKTQYPMDESFLKQIQIDFLKF